MRLSKLMSKCHNESLYRCVLMRECTLCLGMQKVIEEIQAEGEPVLEMSTLTEDGVMEVKTEVSSL